LVFMDKSDSTRPGPLLFIPTVAAWRSFPALDLLKKKQIAYQSPQQ
jgi:hypothetical protein